LSIFYGTAVAKRIQTKGGYGMKNTLGRTLLTSVFVIALATPSWAADEPQKAAPKQEKAMKSAVSHESRDEVKKVQEALKSKGEDPGIIDGVMGKKTEAALKKFQKTNGLKVTGAMDRETTDKLGIEMASTSAKAEKK
jgi:peptidoglycan hydrolase-like protein with peptidoglycan-binding domain